MNNETPRYLVVDDDAPFRGRLARALQGLGVAVSEADSGARAVELLSTMTFSGITLDLRMPGADGLRVLRQIQQVAPSVPVILLTGYGTIATAVEAVKLGARHYLTKPVTARAVLEAFGDRVVEPASGVKVVPSFPSLDQVEREYVVRVLSEHEGNVSKAAKALGLHRRSLQRKLEKLGTGER